MISLAMTAALTNASWNFSFFVMLTGLVIFSNFPPSFHLIIVSFPSFPPSITTPHLPVFLGLPNCLISFTFTHYFLHHPHHSHRGCLFVA